MYVNVSYISIYTARVRHGEYMAYLLTMISEAPLTKLARVRSCLDFPKVCPNYPPVAMRNFPSAQPENSVRSTVSLTCIALSRLLRQLFPFEPWREIVTLLDKVPNRLLGTAGPADVRVQPLEEPLSVPSPASTHGAGVVVLARRGKAGCAPSTSKSL